MAVNSATTPSPRCRLMTGRGNVRQLRNVVDWLLIMNQGEHTELIRAEMLPSEIGADRTGNGEMGPWRGNHEPAAARCA